MQEESHASPPGNFNPARFVTVSVATGRVHIAEQHGLDVGPVTVAGPFPSVDEAFVALDAMNANPEDGDHGNT